MRTSVRTMTSHGRRSADIRDSILSQMAKQYGLRKRVAEPVRKHMHLFALGVVNRVGIPTQPDCDTAKIRFLDIRSSNNIPLLLQERVLNARAHQMCDDAVHKVVATRSKLGTVYQKLASTAGQHEARRCTVTERLKDHLPFEAFSQNVESVS